MGDVDGLGHGDDGGWIVDGRVEHRGGLRADGCGEFVGCGALLRARLHESDAGQAHHAVVFVALGLLDDHLVGHAGRIGQAGHFLGVCAGDAGGRAEDQRGCTARGNQRGLGPEQVGDNPPRARQEGVHVNVVAAS